MNKTKKFKIGDIVKVVFKEPDVFGKVGIVTRVTPTNVMTRHGLDIHNWGLSDSLEIINDITELERIIYDLEVEEE